MTDAAGLRLPAMAPLPTLIEVQLQLWADRGALLDEATSYTALRSIKVEHDRVVLNGRRHRPYVESDPVSPLSVYGRSKAAAEQAVLAACPRSLVVRTAAFFGPWDPYNFLMLALKALSAGRRFTAAADAIVSPTYVPDLVSASLDLLIDDEQGVWHLTNGGAVSWADFGRLAANRYGLEPGLIDARPMSEMELRGPRPRYSALSTERCRVMPPLESAINRFVLDAEHLPKRAA